MSTRALVVCVNYHSDHMTATFIKSLKDQSRFSSVRVIVVDNSESRRETPVLEDLVVADHVTISHPGRNLGYYGGAAWGLRNYLQDAEIPEWIIVSNTDLVFSTDDFFERLFAYHTDPTFGILAPSILSHKSGRDQNPYMRFRPSSRRMQFYKWVQRYYPLSKAYHTLAWVKKYVHSLLSPKHPQSRQETELIYAPHGSFVVFRREYFASGGTLNHGTFLFGEEIFVAETARRLSLAVVFDPRLQILHHEHATTGNLPSRRIGKYIREAAAYCADEFFSTESALK